jgi:glycosyltransferase involved in cell wall biosynthesis
MTANPLVTVVIPTFNRAITIERAIRSVLFQTYSNVEIIIVDDCSSDDTEKIVRGMSLKNLRYLRNEKNLKGGMSRNIGVSVAQGELVAFLDSDDEWMTEKLAIQVEAIRKSADPRRTMCYTALRLQKDDSCQIWPDRGLLESERVADYLFVHGAYMQTSSLIAPTELLKQNPFDASLKKHQDWDLVLRLDEGGCTFRFIDQPLVVWYQDGGQRVSDLVNIKASQEWIKKFESSISESAFWGFMVRIVVPELAKLPLWKRDRGLRILAMAYRRKSIGFRQFVFEIARMSSPVRCRKILKSLLQW